MTDRLTLYNDALLVVGHRALGSLTETNEARRTLDQAWNSGLGVRTCLEEGQWKFAMRTVQLDYDPDVEPSFGFSRAFTKPTDWVVTSAVCEDEYFNEALLQYNDEAGYWYADLDTIYVRYVSNDEQYGMNIGRWPESFREFVAAHLASKIAWKLGTEDKMKNAKTLRAMAKKTALNKDAMADPAKILPPGNWSRARTRGSGRGRGDRGNRTGDLY
jgi:hypothetical protein